MRFLTPNALPAFLDELIARKPSKKKPQSKQSGEAGTLTGKRLLPAHEAAEHIGIAPQTLAKLRWSGESPPYHKIGRKVVYDRDELEKWLKERRRRSTSDRGD